MKWLQRLTQRLRRSSGNSQSITTPAPEPPPVTEATPPDHEVHDRADAELQRFLQTMRRLGHVPAQSEDRDP